MKIKGFPEMPRHKEVPFFYLRVDRTNVSLTARDKNLNFIEARNFYNRGILGTLIR